MFSSVLGSLSGQHQQLQNESVDEGDAVEQHKNFYGGGGGGNQQASSGNMGSAAAMQALKMFQGGGSSGGSSSGSGQNAFIGK
jgi:hypothetical protein